MSVGDRIRAAEERIAAAGYTLRYVDFCEDAETPGILGCYRGVTSHKKKTVKVATKPPRDRAELADALEHEARHAEDPTWDCGNRGVFDKRPPKEPDR